MAEKSATSGQTGEDRPGYEEARAELIEVVRALEAGRHHARGEPRPLGAW